MKYVFWFIGIVLVIDGMIVFTTFPVAAVFCIALGAIILPPVFNRLPFPGWTAYLAVVAGLTAFMSTQEKVGDKPAEMPEVAKIVSDTAVNIPSAAAPEPENWQYVDQKNKMGDRLVQAIVTASNQLQFEFPYAGGSTAQIVLSKKAGQVAVILAVDKGQFMTRIDGGAIRVRFDELPPATYSTSIAADGSTKYIFIDNTSRFITGIRKAKTMVIESEFYQSGLQQMEFDVEGLKWK